MGSDFQTECSQLERALCSVSWQGQEQLSKAMLQPSPSTSVISCQVSTLPGKLLHTRRLTMERVVAEQRRALAEAAAMARGAAVHGDDADSDDDDDLYAGMHSGVMLEGFEHLDVDDIMVRPWSWLALMCCRWVAH